MSGNIPTIRTPHCKNLVAAFTTIGNEKLAINAVLMLLLYVISTQSGAAEKLKQITRLPQWPGVSQLITYQNRVWFVNSQPFEDTNVADIYSFEPGKPDVNYERSLFSQDVGNPVVFKNLLYWPFEDPRRSAGAGEYAVTDGDNWQWRVMQDGRAMHVHAMGVCNDKLVAVTGSWTGQFLSMQPDDTWNLQYDYPSGDAAFSRLVNVSQYNNDCVLGASARGKKESKLFGIQPTGPANLKGWPASDRVDSLTTHKSELFAFADSGANRSLLRHDGQNTFEINLPADHRPRGMHSDGETLWLISQNNKTKERGQLWRYNENDEFVAIVKFDDSPISITALGKDIYIGTYSQNGGALLQYSDNSNPSLQNKRPNYNQEISNENSNNDIVVSNAHTERPYLGIKTKSSLSRQLDQKQISRLYNELKPLVIDSASTDIFIQGLRNGLARHPDLYLPEFGEAIVKLLKLPLTDTPVTMFTRVPVPRDQLVHWYLLTTLAINGHGRIEPKLLNPTGNIASHRSGKVFDPSIAAIVATGWLKQDDKQTVTTLIQRLNDSEEQPWVKADIIGALTEITQHHFGYNITKWNEWWLQQ